MRTDIILSGVGGQGILSIATIIGAAAIKEGLYIKQAEVHGMSQRGGDVQSNLRISSEPIASDLIPLGKADLIISLEPMEALRYSIARSVASPRAANIVLLGAASPFLGIEVEKIEESIRTVFGRKGEAVVEMNQKAFRAGLEIAEQSIKK